MFPKSITLFRLFVKKIFEKIFASFSQAVNCFTDLITKYSIEKRDRTKYLIDSVVDMKNNYFFLMIMNTWIISSYSFQKICGVLYGNRVSWE